MVDAVRSRQAGRSRPPPGPLDGLALSGASPCRVLPWRPVGTSRSGGGLPEGRRKQGAVLLGGRCEAAAAKPATALAFSEADFAAPPSLRKASTAACVQPGQPSRQRQLRRGTQRGRRPSCSPIWRLASTCTQRRRTRKHSMASDIRDGRRETGRRSEQAA